MPYNNGIAYFFRSILTKKRQKAHFLSKFRQKSKIVRKNDKRNDCNFHVWVTKHYLIIDNFMDSEELLSVLIV